MESIRVEIENGDVLEFPVGTPDSVIDSAVKKHIDEQTLTGREKLLGRRDARFALGVASLPIGAAQLAANVTDAGRRFLENRSPTARDMSDGKPYLGDRVNEWVRELEADKREGMKAAGHKYDVAGGLGMLATGIVGGLGVGVGKSLLGTAAKGAALGGAYGVSTPVVAKNPDNYWDDKTGQAFYGAAFGAAMPIVARAIGNFGRMATGNTKLGAQRLVSRLLEQERPGAKQALLNALNQTDDVTLAAGKAKTPIIAALIKRAGQENAAITSQADDALLGSMRGRLDALPQYNQIDDFVAARKAATAPLYRQARDVTDDIDVRPTLEKINQLIKQNPKQRGLVGALRDAKQALTRIATRETTKIVKSDKTPGINRLSQTVKEKVRVPETQSRELISAHKQIRDLIETRGTGDKPLSRETLGVLADVKNMLDKNIRQYNTRFGVAQDEFARLSRPIEQAKVGESLRRALLPATNLADDASAGAIGSGATSRAARAESFTRAVRDAEDTVRMATGKTGKGFKGVLTGAQRKAINSVQNDVIDAQNFDDFANRGMKELRSHLSDWADAQEAPKLLNRWIVLFNNAVNRAGTTQRGNIYKYVAGLRNNPQELARLIKNAGPEEREAIMMIMRGMSALGGKTAPQEE